MDEKAAPKAKTDAPLKSEVIVTKQRSLLSELHCCLAASLPAQQPDASRYSVSQESLIDNSEIQICAKTRIMKDPSRDRSLSRLTVLGCKFTQRDQETALSRSGEIHSFHSLHQKAATHFIIQPIKSCVQQPKNYTS